MKSITLLYHKQGKIKFLGFKLSFAEIFYINKTRRYPQTNFWIGLRAIEDCQCLSGKTDFASSIEVKTKAVNAC